MQLLIRGKILQLQHMALDYIYELQLPAAACVRYLVPS
jgi:hypothetical protein